MMFKVQPGSKTLLNMATALLIALPFWTGPHSVRAADLQWQTAKLVSYTQQQGSDSGSSQTTAQADSTVTANTTAQDWSYVDYQIIIDETARCSTSEL